MRVVIHVSKFYDWQPVPEGTEVKEQDIAAGRVKPGAGGAMLMKVKVEQETHTIVMLSEHDIIGQVIKDHLEGGHHHTRSSAAAAHLRQTVMPHHAHPSWFKRIEVDDHGPDEGLFREKAALHVGEYPDGTNGLEPEAHDALLASYLTPATNEDHVKHFHKHFRIKGAGQ